MSGVAVAQTQTPQQSQTSVDDNSIQWSVFFELRHYGYDLLRYGDNGNSDSYEFYLADGLTDNDVLNGTLGVGYQIIPKLEVQLARTEGIDNWGDGCCGLFSSPSEDTDIYIDYTTLDSVISYWEAAV